MKHPVILAAAALLASTQFSVAETCQEKFVRLLVDGNANVPTKIDIVTEPKNGAVTKNEFFYQKTGHWMTVMTEPVQPITLAYNNTMYTSSDKGKTWKKIRSMDSEKNEKIGRENRVENAKTVKNAVCGEEELDGVMHDTVEAEFTNMQFNKSQNRYKYWINRETEWITKVVYHSQYSVTTQVISPDPDMALPTPK